MHEFGLKTDIHVRPVERGPDLGCRARRSMTWRLWLQQTAKITCGDELCNDIVTDTSERRKRSIAVGDDKHTLESRLNRTVQALYGGFLEYICDTTRWGAIDKLGGRAEIPGEGKSIAMEVILLFLDCVENTTLPSISYVE